MSLVEEQLPGVKNVRKDFQVKEDSLLAKQLQEREYEDHFNSNVQSRRTAMEDVRMAKQYQMQELGQYKEEQSIRKQQLQAQEELDFQEAERLAKRLEEEEELRRRKDEETALKYQREESEMAERRRRQEEIDMGIAQQHLEREKRQREDERRRRELQDEEAAKRLQELEISKKKKPPQSAMMDLPTYDSLGISHIVPESDSDIEEPVDEQARQEEEDARLARQLMEREQQEEARRKAEQERADIEMARRLHEGNKQNGHQQRSQSLSQDMEIANRMRLSEQEQLRQQRETERRDMQVAQRMMGDLERRSSEQEIDDWEFAKKLQKEELKKAKARQPSSRTLPQNAPQNSQPMPSQPPPSKSLPTSITSQASSSDREQYSTHQSIDSGFQRMQETQNGSSSSPQAKMGKKRQQQPAKENKKSFLRKK